MFENSFIGLLKVHKTGKILDINKVFIEMLGLGPKEETIMLNISECLPGIEKLLYKEYDKTIKKGEKFVVTYPCETEKGEKKHLRYHIVPLWNEEIREYDQVIAMVEDITDFIEAQNALFEFQKLDSIGTIAGGIAHDFNNMLSGILGYASILKAELIEIKKYNVNDISSAFEIGDTLSLHKELKKLNIFGNEFLTYVEGILTSTLKARDLTQRLLQLGQKGKNKVFPIDLNEVIMEVIEIVGLTISPQIQIRSHFTEDLKSIDADPTQMNQLFMNLVLNSAEAIEGRGKIEISTQTVYIDKIRASKYPQVNEGNFVKVSIRDNGIGMDEETQKRMFEPFFTTKTNGKGLGLATVYGIVKNHGGFLNVESRFGIGTNFIVFLPFGTEKRPSKKISKNTHHLEKANGRVLIIEDKKGVRLVLSKMVEKLGYVAFSAETGRKGIELYQRNKYQIDLVLLDVMMPKMNGLETFAALKKVNPKVRVLLCTAYGKNALVKKVLKMGAKGIISKPFRLQRLSELLEQYI